MTDSAFRSAFTPSAGSKLLSEFPEYEAVMPPGYASFAVVRAGELSGAIIRAVQFAYDNSPSIRMRSRGKHTENQFG